jgi:hypothetical protein
MNGKWLIHSLLVLCSAAVACAGLSWAEWNSARAEGDTAGGASGIHVKSVSVSQLMASQDPDWHDAPQRGFVLNASPGDLIISASVQFSVNTEAYPGSFLEYNLKLSGDTLGDVYMTRGSSYAHATSTQWSTTEYAVNSADLGSGYQLVGASTSAPLLIQDESTTVQLRLRNFNETTRVRDSVIRIVYLKKDSFTIDLNTPRDEP